MFSALHQGSPIYIIDKTDGLKYKTGEVISVIQGNSFGGTFGTTTFAPNGNITLKVKLDDNNIIDYPEVPRNNSIASYNNGATIVCDNKQGLVESLEKILQDTKQLLADRPKHEQIVSDCEELLKELNPVFAKDKERDDRINDLDNKVTNVEGKLDKILTILSTNSNPNKV